jgi:hypothetical protein
MNIREIFNFKSSIDKVKLDKENNQDSQSRTEEDIHLNNEQEMPKSLKDEWNQEYELIYLSYVLER